MAAKSKNKKVKKTSKTQPKPKQVKSSKPKPKSKKTSNNLQASNQAFSFNEIRKQIKLDESYVSLVLGFLVVIVIFIAAIFFLKGEKIVNEKDLSTSPTPNVSGSATVSPASNAKGKIYVMQENESLWDIAVREYGDGFAYTRIIEANNFENPDYVPPGTKIIIPPTK